MAAWSASATPPSSASAPMSSASSTGMSSDDRRCWPVHPGARQHLRGLAGWRPVGGAGRPRSIGAIRLRTSGIYFIMITLAFAQMLFYLRRLEAYGGEDGGDDGIALHRRDDQLAAVPVDARCDRHDLLLCLPSRCSWPCSYGICRRLVSAAFGMVVGLPRERAAHAGAGLRALPVQADGLRASRAPAPGWPARCWRTPPSSSARPIMQWTRSGELIVMVVLGGMGTLFGPSPARRAFVLLEECAGRPDRALADHPRADPAVRRGVRPARHLRAGSRDRRGMADNRCWRPPACTSTSAGWWRPTASTLTIRAGEIHAVIGPNGAGKTTLIAQLAGELRPDGGAILFDGAGRDARCRSSAGRRRAGALVPDHQRLPGFQRLGERGPGGPGPCRAQLPVLARRAARDAALTGPARDALELVGLGPRADVPAGDARRMASSASSRSPWRWRPRPRMLLLDEPMAGMGPAESRSAWWRCCAASSGATRSC